jgi:hypothetical protein
MTSVLFVFYVEATECSKFRRRCELGTCNVNSQRSAFSCRILRCRSFDVTPYIAMVDSYWTALEPLRAATASAATQSAPAAATAAGKKHK